MSVAAEPCAGRRGYRTGEPLVLSRGQRRGKGEEERRRRGGEAIKERRILSMGEEMRGWREERRLMRGG